MSDIIIQRLRKRLERGLKPEVEIRQRAAFSALREHLADNGLSGLVSSLTDAKGGYPVTAEKVLDRLEVAIVKAQLDEIVTQLINDKYLDPIADRILDEAIALLK